MSDENKGEKIGGVIEDIGNSLTGCGCAIFILVFLIPFLLIIFNI